jgi:hypothetical protein
VALPQRDGERDLVHVEDRDRGRRAGQLHALGLAPRDAVRDRRWEVAEQAVGDVRRLDGDDAGGGEQLLSAARQPARQT